MLLALVCIPILIRGLGKERFGVLTLAWALIGYASLFDLGLGRALTQLVAQKLGSGEEHEVASVAWTSLVLMCLLGVVGAGVVLLIAPWLVDRMLKIQDALRREVLISFYLLGISIPAVIVTSGLRGLMEAHQRFDLVNILRVPMGIFSFGSPLLVLPFSNRLVPIVSVLVVGRFIWCGAHLLFCFRVAPELRDRIAWHSAAAGPLLRFGGWMTVSNVVSPMMVTLDRFLIGTVISVTAVAYYATPYEVATKFLPVAGALVSVMFPAFSTSSVQNLSRTALLFDRSLKCLFALLFPLVLLVILVSPDALTIWLGADFAQHSFRVLQWLTLGIFINCLAQVPFAMVQGLGRPDVAAKLHLLELPVYAATLYWLTKTHGIDGAAVAWTARVAVDALALLILTSRLLPIHFPLRRYGAFSLLLGSLILALMPVWQGIMLKSVFFLLTIAVFVVMTWFFILDPEERSVAGKLFNGAVDRNSIKALSASTQELGR